MPAKNNNKKTKPIPEWDMYFYEIAAVVARRSKDKKQVGAVIASGDDHVLLSTGYNGPARDVLDLKSRLIHPKGKYSWMCHAEANAIYNAVRTGVALAGGTIYVTKFPCVMCASAIKQVGLARVYTLDPKVWTKDPYDDRKGTISRTILSEGGIKVHAPNFPPPGRAMFMGSARSRASERGGTTARNPAHGRDASPAASKSRNRAARRR